MEPSKVAAAARLLIDARRTGKPIKELPPEIQAGGRGRIPTRSSTRSPRCSAPRSAAGRSPFSTSRAKSVPAAALRTLIFASPAKSRRHSRRRSSSSPRSPFASCRPAAARQALSARGGGQRGRGLPVHGDRRHPVRHAAPTIRQRLDERATLVEAYADHQTNGAFIIGPGIKDWRDIDFGAERCDERRRQDHRRDGRRTRFRRPVPAGRGAGEPATQWAGLKAGQVVATGSFSGFFPVEIGQQIVADFEGVGSAEAMFVK